MTKLSVLLQSLLFILVFSLLTACGQSDEVTLPTRFVAPSSGAIAAPSATLRPTDIESPTEPSPIPTELSAIIPTATRIVTATITVTPSLTITDTPTRTPSITPSPTQEVNPLLVLALTAAQTTLQPSPITTVLPLFPPTLAPYAVTPTLAPGLATPLPATQCLYLPPGGFGQLIIAEPNLVNQIGCPVGSPPVVAALSGASQQFQGGSMAWIGDTAPVIYVFYNNGTFQRFDDTFNSAVDSESGGETPPAGLFEPVRGFGKVWRNSELVRASLGWALAAETTANVVALDFTLGRMLYLSSRGEILVLTYQGNPAMGTWRAVFGSF